MYKVRLSQPKSNTYDIFDKKELIIGSIKQHHVSGVLVQLMGEVKRFNSLSQAVIWVTAPQQNLG
jgi:hypothetical protein